MSSLDNLRKAAKRWFKALQSNDAESETRLRRVYPRAPAGPTLRDVQHALALERGLESWAALKKQVTADASPTGDSTALTALLGAADRGDAAEVAALVDANPDIVSLRGVLAGHTGLRTALHFGVRHEPVVRALLDRGADPNVRDEGDNAMPLHFAAENQDLRVIQLLIGRGADPIGAGDGHELEVIGWACCWDYREANTDVVDYLVAHGARHHIFSAVAMGEIDTIRTLVAESPTALKKRMDGTNKRRTPLHLAVVKQQTQSVTTLLELGAGTEELDEAGLTPLDQAAIDGHADLAQVLIDHGAALRLPAAVALEREGDIERLTREDPDCLKPGRRFGTLIVRAAAASPGRVVERLIQLGASVNVHDAESTAIDGASGYTPLHAAAFHGNESAVRVLLQHGADINAREAKYDGTPAGWANYAGHRHIRDLILRGPIDIFQAIDFDRTERIPQLLKPDPEALNRRRRGYTPLAWAAAKHNVEAMKFLVEEGAELAIPEEDRARLERDGGYEQVSNLLAARGPKPKEPTRDSHAERVARFLEYACWDHRVHGKGAHTSADRAAQRLLAQHPEISRDNLYAAIVCGELEEVRRVIEQQPALVNARGGSRGWTPLLYLCYTRFSHPPAIDNAVAIAATLLDYGADANDYYMAGHSRYSTLVGIAREGEQGTPPHPRREELFRLLLERGARMYDAQVLYNTHFSGDVLWWLKLVHAHAMKLGRHADWADPNWSMLDMGGYGPGALYLLVIAIENNDVELATWLLAHGAGPNAVNRTHPKITASRGLYGLALLNDRREIAELLLRYGAEPTPPILEGEDAFVVSCLAADRDAVEAQLRDHPEYLQSTRALFEAAEHNRPEAVRLLLDLGVSVDMRDAHNTRALHHAASNSAFDVARLLIERGAEIDPRESQFDSTPIGWAAYGDKSEMVDFLSQYTRNVWTLTFRGYVDRLRTLLGADPSLAKVIASDGSTPLFWLPDDEAKALEIVELFLKHGADPTARSEDGSTAAEEARKRGMLEVAEKLAS